MELLDRYLHAIKICLPRAQQNDIVAELSEDIRSQIEDQEARLGRELQDPEIASILKQLGRPMAVASRYVPQTYLIGPMLFPFYRRVLAIVALCYVPVWLLAWIGLAIYHPFYHSDIGALIGGMWGTFWLTTLIVIFVVTLIFAIFEMFEKPGSLFGDWNPSQLPPVRDPLNIPRLASIAEIAANLVFAVWWATGMWSQVVFDRAGVRIVMTPAWRGIFWLFLMIASANVILVAVNLLRRHWTWGTASLRLAVDCAGAIALCWLSKANLLSEIIVPGLVNARAAEIVNAVNSNMAKAFPIVVIGCVLLIALTDVPRLVRLRTSRTQLIQGLAVVVMLVALNTGAGAQSPVATPTTTTSLPSDAEIREFLVDRVDLQHKSVGTVVGIISPQGRRIIAYGHMNQGDPRPVDGDTVFEIGSITKVFTALLLSDMVQNHEVALSDPVEKYLPQSVKVPERNGRQITLADLATHTSGLPFLPTNFPGVSDPASFSKHITEVAAYSDEQLYQFLSTYQLENDPGSHWAYSNLGVGLLGKALSRRAGRDYEHLVHKRITGRLGMPSTAITISPRMKSRLGAGHDAKLEPVPDWTMPIFAGAGSLRSTANDLLTFLGAFMGYTKSPLQPAMTAMLEMRRPGPNLTQALGWWVVPFGPNDDGIVTFAGVTLGYSSVIAYDPKTRVGVVVLSNGAPDDGGLGWHLLRPALPVATAAAVKALKERKEVTLDPKLLDGYVGQYQPAVGGVITIVRQGDGLLLKSPSAPQGLRLHAQSERVFFITEADITITLEVDSQGRATTAVVRFAGEDTRAPRIEAGLGHP